MWFRNELSSLAEVSLYIKSLLWRVAELLYCVEDAWHLNAKWIRPFVREKKFGFCACAITFQLASTAWETSGDNTAHARCMLDTQSHKHTLTICHTYWFSTVTMVMRTLLYDTWNIHYLPCLIQNLTDHTTATAKVRDSTGALKRTAVDSHRELCFMMCISLCWGPQ